MIIAVDGIDGSGKGTQCRLLREALEKAGKRVRGVSFPVYESFFGKMIAGYLNGDYGSLYSLNPKMVSLLFAMDRKYFFEKTTVSPSEILIFDRYVLSNMAHQGVKVETSRRNEFFDWLKILEYQVNRIPHPDISIILDMEPANSMRNIAKKQRRTYTDLTFDLHESNAEYLKNTRDLFLGLAETENAEVIRCDSGGLLKPESAIASEIEKIVFSRITD